VVSEVFAPYVSVAVVLWILAFATQSSAGSALLLALTSSIFVVLIPMGYVAHRVAVGKADSRHVPERRDRLKPGLVALGSVCIGVAALLNLNPGPRFLSAFVSGMVLLVSILTATLITKVSAHVAILCGSITILALAVSPWFLVPSTLVPLVWWSRRELNEHTNGQILVGLLIGCASVGLTFHVASNLFG
jgi:hypothetical protein